MYNLSGSGFCWAMAALVEHNTLTVKFLLSASSIKNLAGWDPSRSDGEQWIVFSLRVVDLNPSGIDWPWRMSAHGLALAPRPTRREKRGSSDAGDVNNSELALSVRSMHLAD